MQNNPQPHVSTLFEVSWEICNKVGGIYTVVSSKILEAQKRFGEKYFLLGPERGNNAQFIEATSTEDLRRWETFRHAANINNLKCRFGYWDIPGKPKVILVDWKGKYNQNQLLYDLWHDFGVDSLTGAWDYVEPVMFSTACGEAIAAFAKVIADENDTSPVTVGAHFHEWMCGAGLLYLKRKMPNISTVFTTHATMLGRSLCGAGRNIYAEMSQIDPTKEARNYNVMAKCSMETVSAREADCFTTVSDLTANEAAAFLRCRPTVVTPNGLSLTTIPDYSVDRTAPLEARKKIIDSAAKLLRAPIPENTRILIISGRYEYHNKGIDLFIDALAKYNRTAGAEQKPILALLAVMGGHNGANPSAVSGDANAKPKNGQHFLTSHNVFDSDHDAILTNCMRLGLDNRPENAVKVIFNPAQLNGNDGFFNMPYWQVLSACDAGFFPSWYEPWGYTPEEAIAYAVPTVTCDLAGFGQWAKNVGVKPEDGVFVLERNNIPYDQSVSDLCDMITKFASYSDDELSAMRKGARKVAEKSDWGIFFKYYDEAYSLAAAQALKRVTKKPVAAIDDANLSNVFAGNPSTTPLLHSFTSLPKLPAKLARLGEFARNMWWTWHPEYEFLFSRVSPTMWEKLKHSAVELLDKVDVSRFEELSHDPSYVALYDHAIAKFDAEMKADYRHDVPELDTTHPIAYFSTEYGIHESLPIYSGGLGILSGDHLKSASDLRLPLVAVGLMYKCGYFQQQINANGEQVALYPENNFRLLPIKRMKHPLTGEHLYISLDFPGRTLYARVWRVDVGRIPLYLLDTDTPKNTAEDRIITEKLYVADRDTRIRQEILLGVGGSKMLAALGYRPRAYHMNEGHSAFMVLERIRHMCLTRGLKFEAAREVVRGDSIFTTHTPVDAGNEKFSGELIHRYFDKWCDQLGLNRNAIMDLGRRNKNSNDFEMTILALNHSIRCNGVSRLHGSVARAMWQFNWPGIPTEEVPIGSITNGVHLRTFVGKPIAALLTMSVGGDWDLLPPSAPQWKNVENIPDSELWNAKQLQKKALFNLIKKHYPHLYQKTSAMWKVQPLIIGFARRFAPYKRATLILADTARLIRILSKENRPVIFVYSGKAHPADAQGADLIKQITALTKKELKGKLFFIPNYNLDIARTLVQGCDIWLNTPRRPYEASGTSGEKAAPNGTLNFSISDGWWCEGDNGKDGWTIGPKVTSIHDLPADQSDYADAESFYTILEDEIMPMYFNRGEDGLPHDWIARMKNSIEFLSPMYNSARMVLDYYKDTYEPAAVRHIKLRADNRLMPRRLADWKADIGAKFSGVRIEQVEVHGLKEKAIPCTSPITIKTIVNPGKMNPDELQVQFVAGRSEGRDFTEKPDVVVLERTGKTEKNALVYEGTYIPNHNGHFLYGIRAIPYSTDLECLFDTHVVQWG